MQNVSFDAGKTGIIIFDAKTTEELLSLMQKHPQMEKQQMWAQHVLFQRLGFLVELLPKSKRGLLLCLEVPDFMQKQRQLLHRLLQQLVEELLVPALTGSEQQQQMLPVVCLDTADDVTAFVNEAAAKTGLCVVDGDTHVGDTVSAESLGSDDFVDLPCLFVVPSWQQFFATATETLFSVQHGLARTNTQGEGHGEDFFQTGSMKAGSSYLATQRQLKDVAELLNIDMVALDSPCAFSTGNLADTKADGCFGDTPSSAAASAAAAVASSPWLLQAPVTRAIGPHVWSYIRVVCTLLGIDAAALQQRVTEDLIDWKEASQKRETLDAAAAATNRRLCRRLRQVAVDHRSSCYCSPVPEANSLNNVKESPKKKEVLFPNKEKQVEPAISRELQHAAAAVVCSYWDESFFSTLEDSTGCPLPAASVEPLLHWASAQLRQLRILVSGSIVSNVLLAGDLVSLICGYALNGDVAVQHHQEQSDSSLQQADKNTLNPCQKADMEAAVAAATATSSDGWSLPRGWLRLWRAAATKDSANASGCAGFNIQPQLCGLKLLREFLQEELLELLTIGRRNVLSRPPNCK